jgi:hypothetical protein
MPTWAKSTARATLLTASFVALGAGPALADVTDGTGSVLGGNQIKAPVSAPVDVSGNAVAVAGRSVAGSTGGASVRRSDPGGGQSTSGRHSVGGGNQVNVPIKAPVNVCGNAVGHAVAGCEGGAAVTGPGSTGGGRTSGRHSVLGGNQVNVPVTAPINVCGNAAAVIGRAVAGCDGGAGATGGDHCASPHHSFHTMRAPLSELPQLPGTSPRTGAVAANPAAMPAFPRLRFRPIRHLNAPVVPAIPDAPKPPTAVPVPPTGQNTSVPFLPATGNAPVPSLSAGRNTSVPSLPTGRNVPVPSLPATGNTPATGNIPGAGSISAPAEGSASAPTSQARQSSSVPVGRLDDLAGGIAGALPDLPKPVRVGAPVNGRPTAVGTAKAGSPIGSAVTGTGVADAIPGAWALPDLPSVPVTRPVPQAGAALPVPGRLGLRPAGGQPERIPSMRTVAAQEPAQAERGALAALALAGLLAASSGAISMVRRFRSR